MHKSLTKTHDVHKIIARSGSDQKRMTPEKNRKRYPPTYVDILRCLPFGLLIACVTSAPPRLSKFPNDPPRHLPASPSIESAYQTDTPPPRPRLSRTVTLGTSNPEPTFPGADSSSRRSSFSEPLPTTNPVYIIITERPTTWRTAGGPYSSFRNSNPVFAPLIRPNPSRPPPAIGPEAVPPVGRDWPAVPNQGPPAMK